MSDASLRVALVVSLGCASAMALAAPAWRPYTNERFGTAADVPADWRADAPPANGDGIRFVSPDGKASATVSGGFHAGASIQEALADRMKPADGETITYKLGTGRLAVVSGHRGDTMFYRKSVLGCGDKIWNDLSVEYPASQQHAFDALVTRMAASLHQGRGLESRRCGR